MSAVGISCNDTSIDPEDLPDGSWYVVLIVIAVLCCLPACAGRKYAKWEDRRTWGDSLRQDVGKPTESDTAL